MTHQHGPKWLRGLLSLTAVALLAITSLSVTTTAQKPNSKPSKILHDALSKPVISKSFQVQHALIPNRDLVANWGKLPDSTSWSQKTALVLDAHDPPALTKGAARPNLSSAAFNAARVWVAKVNVADQPSEVGLSVNKPADAMYALRIVGDEVKNPSALVRLYPACWVSSSDSIRMHIDETGNLFAFDWIPGSPVCSESDKVIVAMRTEAQVTVPKLLPRPLKPVPASAKVATPRPRLKMGYKPAPAKATGTNTNTNAEPTDAPAGAADGEDQQQPAAEVGRQDEDEPELGDVDVDDKPEDRRSFLSKYWMYIVPVLLILIMGGPVDEPKKGAAAAGGGGARSGGGSAATKS